MPRESVKGDQAGGEVLDSLSLLHCHRTIQSHGCRSQKLLSKRTPAMRAIWLRRSPSLLSRPLLLDLDSTNSSSHRLERMSRHATCTSEPSQASSIQRSVHRWPCTSDTQLCWLCSPFDESTLEKGWQHVDASLASIRIYACHMPFLIQPARP